MEKKVYVSPEIDLSIVIAENFLSSSDSSVQAWIRSADLLTAGGTCGGLWRLPGIGGVYYQSWFPEDTLTRGYAYTGPLLRYVTPGLSADKNTPLPSFRLFNTPEISLLTFTSEVDLDVLP